MAFANNPRKGRTFNGESGDFRYGWYESNSQSFKKGQWVVLAGDATTGGVSVCASNAVLVMGIAQADATNVSSGNTEIPVDVIHTDDEIIMKCTASGTAKLSTLFYPSKKYGIYVSGNIVYADYDNTASYDCVMFVEPIYDVTGSGTYWGKFKLIPAAAQIGIGI